MLHNRRLWALLSLVIGGLQAWDSGVLSAGGAAQLLIAVGLLAPALALMVTDNRPVWIAALAAGALALVWARLMSPASLNAVHVGLLVPAMYVFFVSRVEQTVASR